MPTCLSPYPRCPWSSHSLPLASSFSSSTSRRPLALPPFNYLCRHPPRYNPWTQSDPHRSSPSRKHSPRSLSIQLARSPCPLIPLPPPTPFPLALSLRGIFSLLPRPPSLVSSSSSLYQLPSSTLSRSVSLSSAAMPMACDLSPFFRGQPTIPRRSHVAPP